MKLPRLAIFVLLLPLPFLSGCQSTAEYLELEPKYYHVRSTNPRGELIANYVAEGWVDRTERGYTFKAVERTSAPPYAMTMRYPRGRRLDIAGPNIIVTPGVKPTWLEHLDTDYYASSYRK